jgi:hypothetical protein
MSGETVVIIFLNAPDVASYAWIGSPEKRVRCSIPVEPQRF